jgi:alkylhydroperoxidase/carboxymuconolactone decarboxylase family protein YurZ
MLSSTVKHRANGNLKVGNSRETLTAAMIQCYPYIGFPRAANAIYTIKEAKLEKDTHNPNAYLHKTLQREQGEAKKKL